MPDDWDSATGSRQALVTENFARRVWPNEQAVGKCLILGAPDESGAGCRVVVGVVRDVRDGPVQGGAEPRVLVPTGSLPVASDLEMLVIQVRGPLEAAVPSLPRSLDDPRGPFAAVKVQPLMTLTRSTIERWRSGGALTAAFGGVAILLVGLGLYGFLLFTVQARQQNVAIRRALGASSSAIAAQVVRAIVPAVSAGLGVVVFAAWLAAPSFRAVLFGVSGRAPVIYAGALAVVGVTAVAASLAPVRRALRIHAARVRRGVA